MCGIIGALARKDAKKIVKNGIEFISHRGIDGKSFYDSDGISFGHALHSVVGSIVQPILKGDYVFGANCEIYNWKELKRECGLKSENDSELMLDVLISHLDGIPAEDIDQKMIDEIFRLFDGVYAFFLYCKKFDYLLLGRDVLGEKPIWFNNSSGLVFASEGKALIRQGIVAEELSPRNIIVYQTKSEEMRFIRQRFLKADMGDAVFDEKMAIDNISGLLLESVRKRIAEKKMGLLFSGGIDSTIIALLLKKLGADFTAYMTASKCRQHDIDNAFMIAKALDFPLVISDIDVGSIENDIREVANTIESSDPVKIDVGLTMHLSLKRAKKDGVKVMLSGIGADDLFAGYSRIRMGSAVTDDTISNLRRIYERDLYRDDTLAMKSNIELRLPFLDIELVRYMIDVPDFAKLTILPKELLRKAATNLGLPEEFYSIKRSAAQYSSGTGKAIGKIAKDKGYVNKGSYISELTGIRNIRLGALFSSGKDSTYAMHIQQSLNYSIDCLITIKSRNQDSFMFHVPTVDAAIHQADALDIPLLMHETDGDKEKELDDLKEAISIAKKRYGIQGIVTGAVFSNYQRKRIEKICDRLNLKVYSPLWHMDQDVLMKNLLDQGFEFVMTRIAAEGLDRNWLGVEIDYVHIDKLKDMRKKVGFHSAGEGGEFETLVLDCPMFKKRLRIIDSEIVEEGPNRAELIVKKITLEDKE